MTDEERLIEAVRKRVAHLGLHSHLYDSEHVARELVRSLRARDGITLTPPPAPEPTYAIRLTADEREWLIEHVGWNEWQRPRQTIAVKLRDATPDDSATE